MFVDYILAYEIDAAKDQEWQQKREEKRREFEANLEKANLELEAEGIEVHLHVLAEYNHVHCTNPGDGSVNSTKRHEIRTACDRRSES